MSIDPNVEASLQEMILGNAVVNYKALLAVVLMASRALGMLPSQLLNLQLTGAGLDLHPQVRQVLEWTRQEMLKTNR